MKSQLIIFAKNPRLGQVKSRLAYAIGEKKALTVYRNLLTRTHHHTKKLAVDKCVYYSDHIEANDLWEDSMFQKRVQQGKDLGERMYNAIRDTLSDDYEKICLIGTDIPHLYSEIINEAFSRLDDADIVLGPSTDGGYYLIGMKAPYPELFEKISWSTSRVLVQTKAIAEKNNLTFALLKELNDIDRIEDIDEEDAAGLLN